MVYAIEKGGIIPCRMIFWIKWRLLSTAKSPLLDQSSGLEPVKLPVYASIFAL